MKKVFFTGVFALALVAIVGYGINKNQNVEQLSDLALQNVEALAQFEGEFNNQSWDTNEHWYNYGDWTPDKRKCTVTSGNWSVGEGIIYNTSTVSYEGDMIICINGNGNCFNGTDCI